MTDRPILFSAPMILALLTGRKTQTRRLCAWANNPNSPQLTSIIPCDEPGWFGDEKGECQFTVGWAPGDRAYVRETWKPHSLYAGVKPRDIPKTNVFYGADNRYAPSNTPWVPCIHMPRWASRLTLFVEDVRVQRLQDISEDDALAEGIQGETIPDGLIPGGNTGFGFSGYSGYATATSAYAFLWDSLHTEPGTRWDDNPWIYALTFRVARGNIDQLVTA